MERLGFVLICCLLIIMSGCENNSGTVASDIANEIQSSENNLGDDFITLTSEITELEPGFSAVCFDGDYAFEDFLNNGGASSDREVLQFLAENVLGGDSGLKINAAPFGCSTISAANGDGGCLFGRNFDWNTCEALVVTAYPSDCYASISTVNLGFISSTAPGMTDEMTAIAALYAPLDGMNEKGLCVSVNMIQDNETIRQDTDKPDLTTTTAVRLLLDRAGNVDEALELLRQYDLHASMDYMVHFAVADASGKGVAVEYINNEMIIVDTPVLTNFYLAEGDKYGIGTAQSHTRFEILADALESDPEMTSVQMRDALDSVSKDNFGEFESTEWSIVFDQSALTAEYYHRENYDMAYSFRLTREVLK